MDYFEWMDKGKENYDVLISLFYTKDFCFLMWRWKEKQTLKIKNGYKGC